VEAIYNLKDLKVYDLPDNGFVPNSFRLTWASSRGQETTDLAALKPEEKKTWMNELKSAIITRKTTEVNRINALLSQ